jgi:hypothetical protein
MTAGLVGRLERRRLEQGTKSEHWGMVLVDGEGQAHPLRRTDGNPFKDEVLEGLEGRLLNLQGEHRGASFWVESWEEGE